MEGVPGVPGSELVESTDVVCRVVGGSGGNVGLLGCCRVVGGSGGNVGLLGWSAWGIRGWVEGGV